MLKRRILIVVLAFLVLSNTGIGSNMFRVFFGPWIIPPFTFVTSDYKYCASSTNIDHVLRSPSYKGYRQKNPSSDHKLYRMQPEREIYQFWMWREYLFNKGWRTPGIKEPKDIVLNCVM